MKRQTYTSRIAKLGTDYGSYRGKLRTAEIDSQVNTQLLTEMMLSGQRVARTMELTQGRAFDILRTALDVAGMKEYIPVWSIELYDPNTVSTCALPVNGAVVRFRLIMHSRKWKGSILRCPLMKIMPMEFPIAWLDMNDKDLRKVMQNKL